MKSFESSVQINVTNVVNRIDALLDDNTMLQLQDAFATAIDPWTPFLTGQLSGDITIDSSGVTYNVDYARKKYYGEVFHKEVHPLATSHWDKVAIEQGAMDTLYPKVKDILIARAKELYG